MKGEIKVKNGMLILDTIHFKKMFEKHIIRHDSKNRQGKVTLPADTIGKNCFVIIKEDEKKKDVTRDIDDLLKDRGNKKC